MPDRRCGHRGVMPHQDCGAQAGKQQGRNPLDALSSHPPVFCGCLSLAEASRKSSSKGGWEMESTGSNLPGHRGWRDRVAGVQDTPAQRWKGGDVKGTEAESASSTGEELM